MRKGKLILSIAVLCMAIATLCTGVYCAVNSIEFSLNGNLGYAEPEVEPDPASYYFTYEKSDSAVAITGFTDLGATLIDVEIPGLIEGLPVTSLGNNAFSVYSKTNLMASVILPDSCVNFGFDVFLGCTNLKSVKLSENTTMLGMYMFMNCTELASITLPSKLAVIHHYSFSGCTKLISIAIPNSVTTIYNNAFGQSGLQYVSIGSGVKSIGNFAFFGTPLTSVLIPASVTSIGSSAFSNCTNLKTVYVDSPSIASGLSASSAGELIRYATTIGIRTTCSVSSYISTNYNVSTSGNYYVCTKK